MTSDSIQTHDEPTPLGCDPADLAWVESTVKQAGTSFAAGMRILPPMRRYGMYAIYAFCRVVDDIADGHAPLAERTQALEDWHGRIAALYGDQSAPLHEPLDRVLLAAVHFFSLRQEDFTAVIDGMIMDTQTVIVAPDEKTLDQYCDRVASAVGRLSVRIFGESSKNGDDIAYHLGRALQLTNILRDIPEDAARGRLYLPADLLTRFKVPHDPIKAMDAPGLEGVCRVLATRAEDHFRAAFTIMKACRGRTIMPARIMGAGYRAILLKLCKRGWAPAVLRDRPRSTLLGKVAGLACSYLP
ncbi:presqualene diphosphate synthase HpnD [Acetobacter sp. TBRC 12305]|uniref:Presqualene diphosphate synthase HpnD n=1 Tax=Acetobacter garciniae TaxID=2817435 RepID=A0A939HPG0_9PROT|nr:presqualene diphosphate synthase HpnD [Acetobacter garciniae]MBX0344547.1 presqualene diphosphate synthase HpnD [Acetobacter garciniae]